MTYVVYYFVSQQLLCGFVQVRCLLSKIIFSVSSLFIKLQASFHLEFGYLINNSLPHPHILSQSKRQKKEKERVNAEILYALLDFESCINEQIKKKETVENKMN